MPGKEESLFVILQEDNHDLKNKYCLNHSDLFLQSNLLFDLSNMNLGQFTEILRLSDELLQQLSNFDNQTRVSFYV